MVLSGISELPRTLHDVLLVVQVQFLVQRTGWFEIDQLELEAQVINAIAQYPYQSTLMNLVLQHVVEAVFRLGTVFLLIQFPFLRLSQTEKLDQRFQINGTLLVVGGLSAFRITALRGQPVFDVGFKIPFFQVVVVHILFVFIQ